MTFFICTKKKPYFCVKFITMLKNNRDIKSIVFMLAITALFFTFWFKGAEIMAFSMWLYVPLYIVLLYLSVTVAVMAHNHNHLNVWKSNIMNIFHDNWLTIFYGFPVFAWIPTHNTNHHTHVNTEEDYTKTYRYTEKNNLFTSTTYPSVSSYFQQPVVIKFYKEMYGKSKKKFWLYTLQIVCLVSWVAAAFILGGWQKALIYVVIPQQFSLYSVLFFNYIQHVHADEMSKYNNSRNFTGAINAFLFNNGLHTAHHFYPSVHWSEMEEEHKRLAPNIDSSLIETSYWGYLIRVYIVSIFVPKYRSKSMRVARIKRETQMKKNEMKTA